MNALLQAVYKGDIAGIQAVIAAGADPNGVDERLRTPLIWAGEWNKGEAVPPLIASGAQLEAKDKDGDTALLAAARSASVEAVKALIAAGANLSARDGIKSTAFGTALGSPLGFKERSLQIAQALAAAMPEGTVRDELRERLEDQQISLLKIRNAAVGALNELVTKMKEVGIAGLDDEQRDKLKKMLETGQAIETEATSLQADGDQLLKSLTDDPRNTIAAAFQYADKHQSLTFKGQFLGLDTVVFLHQL